MKSGLCNALLLLYPRTSRLPTPAALVLDCSRLYLFRAWVSFRVKKLRPKSAWLRDSSISLRGPENSAVMTPEANGSVSQTFKSLPNSWYTFDTWDPLRGSEAEVRFHGFPRMNRLDRSLKLFWKLRLRCRRIWHTSLAYVIRRRSHYFACDVFPVLYRCRYSLRIHPRANRCSDGIREHGVWLLQPKPALHRSSLPCAGDLETCLHRKDSRREPEEACILHALCVCCGVNHMGRRQIGAKRKCP